jgi:pSer/pThr/pTyr-binding forkhead associated (FHA) protein
MEVSLVMFKSDGTRRDFPLKKQRLVVGRTNHCDLRVPLPSVSRQHCEIWVEDEEVHLRDLGSSNGTFHNKERIQHAVLGAGDEIMIGPVVFQVVIDGVPANIQPVHTVLNDQGTSDGSAGTLTDSPAVGGATSKSPGRSDESDQVDEFAPLDDDEVEDLLPLPADDDDNEDVLEGLAVADDDEDTVPARPDRPGEINAIPLEEGNASEVLPVLDDEDDPFAEPAVADEEDDIVMLENPADSSDPADASGATSNIELNFDEDDPIAALEAMAESESREEVVDFDDEPISLLDDEEDK